MAITYNNWNNYNNSGDRGEAIAASDEEMMETLPKKRMSFGDFANGANGILQSMGGLGVKGGNLLAGIPDMFGVNQKYGFSEDEKAAQSTGRELLGMIPGYGQLFSLATGAVDALGTAKRAGISGTWFNKTMNMLPGNSMIWGGLSRLFGNDRTDKFTISNAARSMSDGYSGTMRDLTAAEDLGDRQLFFGQTGQANKFINTQKNNDRILADIGRTNTLRKQSDYAQDLQNQNINRYAGQNYLNTVVGKNGLKLMSVEEARKIIALKKQENTEKLQNGGNIPGVDSSILPEGALHAHKNHLDELNPDLEDATKKGIPVMAAQGGEIKDQVAEVENDELVFRLEITKKLEELMKDGSEDAMIEAGKIIANEVIENTVDNTGQITEENGNVDSNNK